MLSTLFKNPSLAVVFLCHAMLLYRLTVPSPRHKQFAFFLNFVVFITTYVKCQI